MKSFFEFKQFVPLGESILYDENLKIDEINIQAIYRTTINRVYMAAYNHTKEWLEYKYGLKTRIFNRKLGKMANNLRLLYYQRINADYDVVNAKIDKCFIVLIW